MQSLEEQFPRERYKISHDAFKFKDGMEALQLIVPTEHDQCVIALKPTNGKVIENVYCI